MFRRSGFSDIARFNEFRGRRVIEHVTVSWILYKLGSIAVLTRDGHDTEPVQSSPVIT